MIRVVLPTHLRTLAGVAGEATVQVEGAVTQRAVLDALEARYPMLRGTIRDQVTLARRPFLRFFACEQDWTHEPPDAPLPEAVARGTEPFLVVGAMAGGAGPAAGAGAAIPAGAGRPPSRRSVGGRAGDKPDAGTDYAPASIIHRSPSR